MAWVVVGQVLVFAELTRVQCNNCTPGPPSDAVIGRLDHVQPRWVIDQDGVGIVKVGQ